MPQPSTAAAPPLGAILAGGASRRFGAPKMLAHVGGVPIVERVASAVRAAGIEAVLIANDFDGFSQLGLRIRGDVIAGAGALAGVHAAVAWAADEGRAGALCIACDLPFVPAPLLSRILRLAVETGADAVMPESEGRRGVEPLCAYYRASAVDRIASIIRTGERRVHALTTLLATARIPLGEVRALGHPATMFLNVNTPTDHALAEDVARSAEVPA
jgi:molybdopterin-guanine dinucleotide biosynthesis protein A